MDNMEYRDHLALADLDNMDDQEREMIESAKQKMEALKAKGQWQL